MEEFIFDDDADEVGAEVEAHCPKCKADTPHVVVSKYEDEIRRVQCNPCGDVHPYRKPRGDAEEDEPEKPKKKVKAKPTWDQIMAKQKNKPPRPYAVGEFFKENEVLSHPKFGTGFVSENIGDDKIEVTFQNDKRVLIHNRKNLNLPFLRVNQPAQRAAKPGKGKAASAKAAAAAAPASKAAARPAAKKPAAKPAAATKPARPAGKPAKPQAAKAKKPVVTKKSPARTAAKKPAKPAKAVKKVSKKSR